MTFVSIERYFVTEVQQSFQTRRKEQPMRPLPLELTRPIELTSSLEDSLKAALDVATTKYNPETQVREDAAGVPMILNGGGHTSSNGNCGTFLSAVVVVDSDIQVDDNDIL
jgi:hypothetical protein